MIAISSSDYEKFGCVNCGCDFAYNPASISGNGTFPAKCGECSTEFVILADGLEKSGLGFGNGSNDYTYPILQEHPRHGILKHKFVRPDIRPENGIGEFCNSRGVGYDLACFVKSKEAGKRIVDMFDKIFEERKKEHKNCKCFVCGKDPVWLDYRPHEPLWIQVKIQYCKYHERNINVLSQLINEDNIITEDKIRMAMNIEWDFKNMWKYELSSKVISNTSIHFIKNLFKQEFEPSKETKEAINFSFNYDGNVLSQFHSLGCFLQVNSLLRKDDFKKSYLAISQYIQAISFRFTTSFNYKYKSNLKFYIRIAKELNSFLFDNPYENENCFYCDFKGVSTDELTKNYKEELSKIYLSFTFKNLWENIIKNHVCEYADFKYLRNIIETDEYNTIDFSNTNIMSMFNTAGLYFTVNKLLEEENEKMAALAVEQVYNSLTSKFNAAINENCIDKNNEKDKKLYMDLSVLLHSYWDNK